MNRLGEVLHDKMINRAEFARRVGKSTAMISRYVNNKSQPSLELLRTMSEVLEVTIDDLVL